MKKNIILLAVLIPIIAYGQVIDSIKKKQDDIIKDYLTECAEKYDFIYQMAEWQDCIDEGLKKDSTIAYLWQQKAMPYFKSRKYEVGMQYVNKAVKYDAKRWQPYRAFIKCIFAKTYKESIIDFEDCKKKYGNNYVMDHTYNFYIGLCYLQLNEYGKAEKLFKEYNEDIFKNRQGLEHPTALFYYGVSKYEQQKWEEAIIEFDKALKLFPNFSDAKFYKAISLWRLKKTEESNILFKQSKEDYKKGYKLNEDNTVHETYPYQLRFKN